MASRFARTRARSTTSDGVSIPLGMSRAAPGAAAGFNMPNGGGGSDLELVLGRRPDAAATELGGKLHGLSLVRVHDPDRDQDHEVDDAHSHGVDIAQLLADL